MIRRNIELEVRLIDDLLDLNRVTSGKMRLQMQPTHVHAALMLAMQTCDWETSTKKLNAGSGSKCRARATPNGATSTCASTGLQLPTWSARSPRTAGGGRQPAIAC
jgi:hypothetical protein